MPLRILVVDDSGTIRALCRGMLEKAGYEVVEAWDAAQARTALKTQDIAFMLCDLNLPGMSGLELIERMRAVPRFADLPVAILSAEQTPALIERGTKAGVNAWLRKPCTSDQMLAVVSKFARSS